jgi:hypothetical protein
MFIKLQIRGVEENKDEAYEEYVEFLVDDYNEVGDGFKHVL